MEMCVCVLVAAVEFETFWAAIVVVVVCD